MTQFDRDAIRLAELKEEVNELSNNADIAKEAIRIAEYYKQKADNQRSTIKDLMRKIDKLESDGAKCDLG